MKICDMCGSKYARVKVTFDSPVSLSHYELCYECEGKILRIIEDHTEKLKKYLDEYDS